MRKHISWEEAIKLLPKVDKLSYSRQTEVNYVLISTFLVRVKDRIRHVFGVDYKEVKPDPDETYSYHTDFELVSTPGWVYRILIPTSFFNTRLYLKTTPPFTLLLDHYESVCSFSTEDVTAKIHSITELLSAVDKIHAHPNHCKAAAIAGFSLDFPADSIQTYYPMDFVANADEELDLNGTITPRVPQPQIMHTGYQWVVPPEGEKYRKYRLTADEAAQAIIAERYSYKRRRQRAYNIVQQKLLPILAKHLLRVNKNILAVGFKNRGPDIYPHYIATLFVRERPLEKMRKSLDKFELFRRGYREVNAFNELLMRRSSGGSRNVWYDGEMSLGSHCIKTYPSNLATYQFVYKRSELLDKGKCKV